VIAFLWSLAQTVSVVIGRVDGGVLNFGHSWNIAGSAFWAGTFEAFAAGAILEEVIYRGFLLPQAFLLIRGIWKWNLSKSLVAATAVTQCYFAINHLPAALRMNLPAIEIGLYLTQVFFVGVLFVAIFLRTGNLLVAIGIHALVNFPGELFVSRVDPSFVVLVISCAILLSWPYLSRLLGDVFTLRPSVARLAYTP
jgi:membrane protease YdiL (CAAX protease family)